MKLAELLLVTCPCSTKGDPDAGCEQCRGLGWLLIRQVEKEPTS